MYGHISTVQLLLERGAAVNATNHEDKTALSLAIANLKSLYIFQDSCSTGCVDILIGDMRDLDIQDCDGETALHHASASGSPLAFLLVETLLYHGANINIPDSHSRTALQHASRSGLDTSMEYLLRQGADVNWQDAQGLTALHHACMSSSPSDKIHLLIGHQADLDMKSEEGWTALHYACARDDIPTVHVLLRAGADATIENLYCEKPAELTEDEMISDFIEKSNRVASPRSRGGSTLSSCRS
jgi:ankyrin repeat protein